jgi:hypothetical protein
MQLHTPSLELENYLVNEEEGLVYTPSTPPDPIYVNDIRGVAYHTHYAMEGPNIQWTKVKCSLTHSTTETNPIYETVISLYGLNNNHTEELIGEKVYNTINSTPTTVNVSFNLSGGACHPPLTKKYYSLTNPSAPAAGTINLNLPFRYENYESIALNYGATSVTPTSTDDSTTTVTFTTPTSWVEATPINITVKEHSNESYTTNYIPTSTKNTLELGYDGLDKYDALRLKIETITQSTGYNVSMNNLIYEYEVI